MAQRRESSALTSISHEEREKKNQYDQRQMKGQHKSFSKSQNSGFIGHKLNIEEAQHMKFGAIS